MQFIFNLDGNRNGRENMCHVYQLFEIQMNFTVANIKLN